MQELYYIYRVKAIRSNLSSAYSNEVNLQSNLISPTNLSMTHLTASSVKLTWNDNTTFETGYSIEHSVNGGAFTEVGQVAADVTTYSTTGLNPSSDYTFRIKAARNTLSSAYSNQVNLQSNLISPTNLSMTHLTVSSVKLTWNDNTTFETEYVIEHSVNSGTFIEVGQVGADITTYSAIGLDTNKIYSFRVKAIRNSLYSSYSNELKINCIIGDVLLSINSDQTYQIAVSPDGSTIVGGSRTYINTVRLWNAYSGNLIQTLSGHIRSVKSVAFSHDGNKIVSGSEDGTIKLWNANNGALIRTIPDHTKPLSSVVFSPDGSKIASGSIDDCDIVLWDVNTGNIIRKIGSSEFVDAVEFSPNGNTIAGGGADGKITLWDTNTWSLIWTINDFPQQVSSIKFSPDGNTIASGSYAGTIKLWNANTGSLVNNIIGHSGYISSVKFSPDGNVLASGSHEGTIKLWNSKPGSLIGTIICTGSVMSISFASDGNKIISATDDGWVRVLSLNRRWQIK